jgi:hypothetical protein
MAAHSPSNNPMMVLWLPNHRSLIGLFQPRQCAASCAAMFAA